MKHDLYTAGYEGYDAETFVWLLQKVGTKVLVDVRHSARSRNRAFSKSALEKVVSKAGIMYLHIPELGVAAEFRRHLKETGDFASYKKRYTKHLNTQKEALGQLYDLVMKKQCCLMCVEKNPLLCHRTILAAYISKMNGQCISVANL